jgi:hypothetical protein
VFKLQVLLIAIAVSLAIGGAGGWATRDAFCDAARLRVENARLTDALRTASLGASLASSLQTELDTERDKTDELQRQYDDASKDKSCPASDADRAALSRIMRGGN